MLNILLNYFIHFWNSFYSSLSLPLAALYSTNLPLLCAAVVVVVADGEPDGAGGVGRNIHSPLVGVVMSCLNGIHHYHSTANIVAFFQRRHWQALGIHHRFQVHSNKSQFIVRIERMEIEN